MSSEIVERVARVLCKEAGHDPDYIWSDGKPYWDMFVSNARAAIEAMRELPPTCVAIADEVKRAGLGSITFWGMMVEDILKEPEKG